MSWASICETSCDDSEWGDRDDGCLDDIPDLLSDADDSSADDNGDEYKDGHDYHEGDESWAYEIDDDCLDDKKIEEFCLAIGKIDDSDEYMIADTGATVHMRKNTEGMFDLRHEQSVIKYGNGSQSTSTVVGKWSGYITDNGVKKKIILDEVTVVPGSAYNLFSLTRVLSRGSLKSFGQEMVLECQGVTIRFNHRIETANGFLLPAKFEQDVKKGHLSCVSMIAGSTIRAVDLHARLGHTNDDYMRLTAKHMGLEVTGKLGVCESCSIDG
jgi:hypothetical protein